MIENYIEMEIVHIFLTMSKASAMGCAGEREALETGRRWRLVGAGDWEALENGMRWRMGGAGDW